MADHPRSRGVYEGVLEEVGDRPGSSPLARGLRGGHEARRQPGGIIPARAGFTSRSQPTKPWTTDHPRSRGVYGPRSNGELFRRGSSPLARGLLADDRSARDGRGIIPARAGFTRWRLGAGR